MQHLVKITEIERLKNTVNGNPRFKITYMDHNGFEHTDNTANDSAFAFRVGNWNMNVGDQVWIEFSPRGTISAMVARDEMGSEADETGAY